MFSVLQGFTTVVDWNQWKTIRNCWFEQYDPNIRKRSKSSKTLPHKRARMDVMDDDPQMSEIPRIATSRRQQSNWQLNLGVAQIDSTNWRGWQRPALDSLGILDQLHWANLKLHGTATLWTTRRIAMDILLFLAGKRWCCWTLAESFWLNSFW